MGKIGFRLFFIINILALNLVGFGQSPSFKTYTNPVIPGDHPDPTLTRIGNDFYTTGSSFNPTPVIYHSTDLVHWEVISQPVKASWQGYGDRPSGGCWGGHLVYYRNIYWDFFSRAGSMYYVRANDPKGPWSDPVKLKDPDSLPYTLGYDNSIFIDDDGKWYLIVKNGRPNNGIVELGADGQPTGIVYNLNWLNPAPSFPYSWAEGPVIWKYVGYYYYSFARNVTGGQWVMKSKTLTADSASWEMLGNFYNEKDPLKKEAVFHTPNHSSPQVSLDDSTCWVITQSYARKEWEGHARQGLLSQVHYNGLTPVADYPVKKIFEAPKLPGSGIPWMVAKSDFFDSENLNPEWSFLGYTPDSTYSLSERKGWLRLSPKPDKANTAIKIEGENSYSLITRIDFSAKIPGAEAGLRILRSDEKRWVKLYSAVNSSGKKVICFSDDSTKYETENKIGNTVWLKIFRVNHLISGYYSKNGKSWMKLGEDINSNFMDTLSANWIGTRIGLYVQKQPAFFDLFIYRDAFSSILAECPANQFGTVSTTPIGTIYSLDSIHNKDWVLYPGVEFGGHNNYPRHAKIFEVTASSASTGGMVEVWLDSIDTGRKIAECKISNTGNWDTFKTFTSHLKDVNGLHDLYLRFNGPDEQRLFMVNWIVFKED